ncbi:MAG: DUF3604 domain-containing protein [Henriciella sp.]|nr:DUF3604 domain-containing protein [Henriciella sp.]
MFKKVGLSVMVFVLAAAGLFWLKTGLPLQQSVDKFGPDTTPRDDALLDDRKVTIPAPQAARFQAAPNSNINLYWGELHVHTAESYDATLFGNSLSIEDAYRFTKGSPPSTAGGETKQLGRPLDFLSLTDRGEGFGTRTHCGSNGVCMKERAAGDPSQPAALGTADWNVAATMQWSSYDAVRLGRDPDPRVPASVRERA